MINSINGNPKAGWKAGMNQQLSDYTVGQFKRILGARKTPPGEKRNIPVVHHDRSLKLPKEFDARRLGLSVVRLVESMTRVTVVLVGHMLLLKPFKIVSAYIMA